VTRVMFLYHYFFAFLYSLIFVVILLNDLATDKHGHTLAGPSAKRRLAAALVLVALGFLYFAPISYGTPLSPAGLQTRMWLHSWR
jgi:dolichyl-phosphate-mannose-protein mannosyltransferase